MTNLKPLNKFQGKFVINLSERTDRLKDFRNKTAELDIERFEAIRHSFGQRGCGHSHREIVRQAAKRNYETTVVFEDDAEFYNYDAEILISAIENLNNYDWDVFRISYTYRSKSNHGIKKLNDNLFITLSEEVGYTFPNTACTVYHCRCYDKILNEFNPDTDDIVDRWIPQKLNCFYLYPCMVIQKHKKADHMERDAFFQKCFASLFR
jgi:GR25 family glycosyltransferase involved in LPS biosynthesis